MAQQRRYPITLDERQLATLLRQPICDQRMAGKGHGPAFLRAEANDRYGSRPCENGWWRGVERPWHLRFRLQESAGVFQPLWWLDGSRVRAVRTSNGGTALEAT
jgi:hypothetical protein